MAYTNGKIVAPVSVGDLMAVYGTKISSSLGERVSNDVGTMITRQQGDTFTAEGVIWTVTRQRKLNMFAKYRPIPCAANGMANHPGPITDTERRLENYGLEAVIDPWMAGDNWNGVLLRMLNNGASPQDMLVKMKTFTPGTHWARMSDFVSFNGTSYDTSKAYDDDAECTNPTVTGELSSGGDEYQLNRIFSQSQIEIVSGASMTIQYPWDYWYLRLLLNGTDPNPPGTGIDDYTMIYTGVSLGDTNPNWLSAVELIENIIKNVPTGSGTTDLSRISTRGFMLLRTYSDGGTTKWECTQIMGRGMSANGTYNPDSNGKPYRDDYAPSDMNCQNLYLGVKPSSVSDLTVRFYRLGSNNVAYVASTELLNQLTGAFTVMEVFIMPGSGATGFYPVPGFVYDINITRPSSPASSIDTINWNNMTGCAISSANNAQQPAQTSGVIIDFLVLNQSGFATVAVLTTYLQTQYQTLSAYIATSSSGSGALGSPVNLLNSGNVLQMTVDYADIDGTNHQHTCHCLYHPDDFGISQDDEYTGTYYLVLQGRKVGASTDTTTILQITI